MINYATYTMQEVNIPKFDNSKKLNLSTIEYISYMFIMKNLKETLFI